MNNIPSKLRQQLTADPLYKKCLRYEILNDHYCCPDPLTGKLIEWEHALIYGGRQVQERFAIIPICWRVHRGGELIKEINVWLALNRITDEELKQYCKSDWIQKQKYLNQKFGDPRPNLLLN